MVTEDKRKTIYYLSFAKSKLNLKNKVHRKAKEEIDSLIHKLREETTDE